LILCKITRRKDHRKGGGKNQEEEGGKNQEEEEARGREAKA